MGNSPGDEIGNSLKAAFRVLPLSDPTAKKASPMIAPFSKVFILVVFFASVAFADNFKTVDGKEYKNVKVSRVEPDGIVLTTSSGISKVYFTELPKEVQEKFNYDPEKAAAYSAEQNKAVEEARPQREEAMRRYEEEKEKNNKQFEKEQAGIQQ